MKKKLCGAACHNRGASRREFLQIAGCSGVAVALLGLPRDAAALPIASLLAKTFDVLQTYKSSFSTAVGPSDGPRGITVVITGASSKPAAIAGTGPVNARSA